MKYTVAIAGQAFTVEIAGEGVRMNGRVVRAQLQTVPHTPLRQVVVDGASRTFAMVRGREGWAVSHAGECWTAEVQDERARHIRELTAQRTGARRSGAVRAPMPGLVLRVNVEVGQSVEEGAGLVVLEAMKMENEIRAPSAGEIIEIRVEPGEAVEKGVPLVEIGPAPS
jgi:pyruvate carboxylase subunit B